MKRDMDLIRMILLAIEESPKPDLWVPLKIEGYSPEEISYHIKLLAEAGLITAEDTSTFGNFEWQARSLTWEGHEFLEAARDDARWNKTKSTILERGGNLVFEVLKEALVAGVRTAVFS